jgi:hypothetical protein
LSSRPICNADINRLPGIANRLSDLGLSVRAALQHLDSPKTALEQHIWLLVRDRSSSPVQAAPTSAPAAGIPASAIPELPAKCASDDSLATGVMRPAVVTPAIPGKYESRVRDVLVVNASHTPMARLSPMARDSRMVPLTGNTSNPSAGCDSSLGSKACMTFHSRYTASSSHSSMESETHHAC